jgi:hypothetical protein
LNIEYSIVTFKILNFENQSQEINLFKENANKLLLNKKVYLKCSTPLKDIIKYNVRKNNIISKISFIFKSESDGNNTFQRNEQSQKYESIKIVTKKGNYFINPNHYIDPYVCDNKIINCNTKIKFTKDFNLKYTILPYTEVLISLFFENKK